jgi:hypothetical protein
MIYLTRKLNQEPIILTLSQFDHLVILYKLIWTRPIWLANFFIDLKMIFLTNQIKQKIGQWKKIN